MKARMFKMVNSALMFVAAFLVVSPSSYIHHRPEVPEELLK